MTHLEHLRSLPADACDLVMKGGITSGVVYPRAIIELAAKYRLGCVGGTSAGAIAAGLAAAAEHGRAEGGFDVLDRVATEIPVTLTGLFQATPKTRPLLNAALALIKRDIFWRCRAIFHLATGYVASTLIGALLGILAGALAGWWAYKASGGWHTAYVLPMALGTVVGATLLLSRRVLLGIFRDLAQQDFGMCPGQTQKGYKQPALVDWLSARLDQAAKIEGKGPLTFGHLKSRGIRLEVLTTSLAESRPYRLPFSTKRFFFKEEEFSRIFPAYVMKALTTDERRAKASGFYQLPEADELPVIVAIRMSLSFPFLLQAVPLYAIDYTMLDQREHDVFQRCIFSDGGISSNLPVHFFDSPLPSRPTFAINLEEFDAARHRESVSLPVKAGDGIQRAVVSIYSVGGFIGSIVNAMQNWQDNLRIGQPGTRERVVSVRLSPTQGGLNLEMDPKDVDALIELGQIAGQKLKNQFDFDLHRWRRYLTWFGAWEEAHEKLLVNYDSSLAQGGIGGPWRDEQANYRQFLETFEPSEYQVSEKWRADTNARTAELMTCLSGWSGKYSRFSDATLPKPSPILVLLPDH